MATRFYLRQEHVRMVKPKLIGANPHALNTCHAGGNSIVVIDLGPGVYVGCWARCAVKQKGSDRVWIGGPFFYDVPLVSRQRKGFF